MALLHVAACATCNSPHRPEIDKRLLLDQSLRKISKWLKDKHGVDIGHAALGAHKRNHLNALDSARERIADADAVRAEVQANADAAVEEVYEAEVERIIADVGMLDKLARANMRIVDGLLEKMADPEIKKSMAETLLFNGACATVRGCVKDRHDITHEPEQNVTGDLVLRVDTSPVLDDPDSN